VRDESWCFSWSAEQIYNASSLLFTSYPHCKFGGHCNPVWISVFIHTNLTNGLHFRISSVVSTVTSLDTASTETSVDATPIEVPADTPPGLVEGLEINNAMPPRTQVFTAYKRRPHPDELQRTWPLEGCDMAYVVFCRTRVGVFPTWLVKFCFLFSKILYSRTHRDIARSFVYRVSGANSVRFKRFSEALTEYRRRYFRATLGPEIEVRPSVANPLFDFEDPRFGGDLQVVVPPNDHPYVVPIEEDLPETLSYTNKYDLPFYF